MKSISILGICLLTAVTASAQKSLVKEVERNLKSDPTSYPAQMKALAPAFTNPETASAPHPYFIAGKAAYDYYNRQSVFAQMGKDVDKKQLGLAVLEGIEYFKKALPLDSVPDEKGKIKPKHSKDIMKTVAGSYNDFNNAAIYLWEAQDYPDAVKAWNYYITLPTDPTFAKAGIKAPADTLVAEIMFNMGIGNSLGGDNEAALKNFKDAIAKGYTKKNAFDYAISAASQLQKPEEMAAIAEQAYAIYGNEDSRYIGYMVNNLIDKKEYAKADALIDKYIAASPNNAQLYFVKGVLLDSENKTAEALETFRKAVQIDENNTAALFQLGYKLYQKAVQLDQDESAGMTQEQYNAFRAEQVDPLFKEAAPYLEKVLQLDETMSDARQVLRSIYYNLNDEANLKRIETM